MTPLLALQPITCPLPIMPIRTNTFLDLCIDPPKHKQNKRIVIRIQFQLTGRYKSSGGNGIPIGAFNIPQGSVVVTAGEEPCLKVWITRLIIKQEQFRF